MCVMFSRSQIRTDTSLSVAGVPALLGQQQRDTVVTVVVRIDRPTPHSHRSGSNPGSSLDFC